MEAEAWDWLQEDKVSTFRGDWGGVLHSECDSEPAREREARMGHDVSSGCSQEEGLAWLRAALRSMGPGGQAPCHFSIPTYPCIAKPGASPAHILTWTEMPRKP